MSAFNLQNFSIILVFHFFFLSIENDPILSRTPIASIFRTTIRCYRFLRMCSMTQSRHGNNNNNNNNKKGKKDGTSLWHNAILPRPGAWKKQKIQFSTGAGACPRAWRVASPLTSHPLPSPFSFFGRDTRSPRAQGLVSRGSG